MPTRTLNQLVKSLVNRLLPDYGEREANALVRLTFENLKGWSAVDLALKATDPVSEFTIDETNKIIARILDGEPIQYIFGTAYFYGMNLKVTESTLIPRPETAELVDMIVNDNQQKDLKVIDLGTGSGCIAIALARNLPFADVTAIDISPAALSVAEENGAKFAKNVKFIESDILNLNNTLGLKNFNIIVSNPPYVTESEKKMMHKNVLYHEPHTALFVSDNDPLKFYQAIISWAEHALAPDGKLYFEVNPIYAHDIVNSLQRHGFKSAEAIKDSYNKLRFVRAIK